MTTAITLSEEKILLHLSEHLSLSRPELSRLMGISNNHAHTLCERLADKALIETCASSKRSLQLGITERGIKALMHSERKRTERQTGKPPQVVPPPTRAIGGTYVPEPCVYRNDGLKHIKSFGVRC